MLRPVRGRLLHLPVHPVLQVCLQPRQDTAERILWLQKSIDLGPQTLAEPRGELHGHQRIQQSVERRIYMSGYFLGTQTREQANLALDRPLPFR